jgi:glyoxylase-like metal-dependent hydrolase (beta-lactamase superfamily II)
MADTPDKLIFNLDFAPVTDKAVEVLPGVVRITAANSGPYTFTGTNSFVLGYERVAVLDPGPDEARHRAALLEAIGGRPVEAIVLTHTHKDHSAGALALQAATGAPLWFGGAHRLSRPLHKLEINTLAGACDSGLQPDRTLVDGETFEAGDLRLTAIATPGHCANHLCFGIEGTDWLLSGDHIMGWNSTLVAVPDGSMADYLASMRKVIALPYAHYLPAHGGPIEAGPGYARALLAHRELRNRQIVDAVQSGATSISALVKRIYPPMSPQVRLAAGMTVTAHVEYLAGRGLLRAERRPVGLKLATV